MTLPSRRVAPTVLLALIVLSATVSAQAPATPAAVPGIDIAAMDRSVKPGNDFYLYSNGAWMRATEIPADRSSWGVFSILDEEATLRTRGILEEAAKASAPAASEQRKVGDLYASYMDEAAIETRGLTPLRPQLDRIAAVKDRTELARLLGEGLRADVDPLNATNFETHRIFGLWVAPDLNVPTRYAPYLLQGGLSMPDRAYYLDASPRMAELRAKFQAHVVTVLKLAGIADADAKAARILALETKIAQVHASREESEDVLKANNPWKQAEFATRAPGMDWKAYLGGAGLDARPTIFVWQPGAARGISALVASEPLGTWKDYLTFHAIDRRSAVLPRAFVEEGFAFYQKALLGTPKLSERWKRAVATTNALLGDAVGQLYVKRYFPPEAKAQVQEMVKNIIAAFEKRIDRLDWMASQTKAKAREKLSTLYVGVGYPEKWVDYRGLSIERGDLLGNVERAELFEYRRRLAEFGTPVDLSEWCMTPQTVNAVNLPLQNALNFPASILSPPFFDPAAPAAVNYGGIGTVIGHEISHSFDDQGAQFDAHGKLSDWWTPEDLAHFKASGAQLAAQFDGYHPFPDLTVNGKLTLSENLADLAGLGATHDAWLASLGGKPAPVSQGLNGEQQFFIGYAQNWRTKRREASLRRQLLTDGHAPGEYRADTVRNLDPWYTTFDVKPGEALYLAPKDRVRVW